MIENLYELVGGHNVIEAATERFYQKVLEDEALRHFFGRTDMEHLRSRQVMFINMLLGGGVYTGRGLHVAHAQARNAGLNEAHFDMFLKHFQAALEEVGVRSENAGKIIKFLERKRRTSWIHEAASMQFHRIVADGIRYSAEGDGRFWPSRLWVCPSEMTSDKSPSHTLGLRSAPELGQNL